MDAKRLFDVAIPALAAATDKCRRPRDVRDIHNRLHRVFCRGRGCIFLQKNSLLAVEQIERRISAHSDVVCRSDSYNSCICPVEPISGALAMGASAAFRAAALSCIADAHRDRGRLHIGSQHSAARVARA
jgi:hypothetical protein